MATVDVKLVDVVKMFGDAVAVDHIDLEVVDGEFFSLLGPSGCGKTTTLRMIGGFEAPTSGLIELQGQDVTWLPPYQRNVNTVFQNYALFPHLTIFENVAFGLRRKGVKDGEVKARVSEMLKLVELPGFDARKPTQISGGQAQRVALARALINKPAVLLLDEPLGALDLKLRKQMQVELKRIQQEVGITFIYVTHDQEEAMTMSDRIAVMNKGRYEQLGEPEVLYERPTTRFVAGFLGISNLLPGDGRGRRRQLCGRPPRRRHARPGAARPGGRPCDRERRRPAREDPAPRGRPRAAGRPQPLDGRRSRCVVSWRQHAVPDRGPRGCHDHGLRAERRTCHEGRALDARGGRPDDLVTGPHLRRGGRAGPRGRLGQLKPDTDTDPGGAPVNETPPTPDRHLSRRRFVQGSAMAGFAVFLAACGRAGTSAAPSTAAESTPPSAAPSARRVGRPQRERRADAEAVDGQTLNWANWTYYIGRRPEGREKFKTLEDFKAKYGTTVNYQEVIDDNDAFVGTIKPQLQAGKDTGWDLIVLTDWMAARLIRLEWVEQMDLGNMPNVVANLQDVYKNVTWDPTNDHHVPWQSGMTGLGYDQAKTGDLTSLDALYDPKYKGKVDYLTEMRDTIGLTMLKLGPGSVEGHRRTTATRPIAEIKKAVDAGIVRAFKGNEYAEDLDLAAMSSCRWPGRATWSRRSRTSKTSRFTSPTRAGCSGPTTA